MKVKVHTLRQCGQCDKTIPTQNAKGFEMTQSRYEEVHTCGEECRRRAQSIKNRANRVEPRHDYVLTPMDRFLGRT